MGNSNQSGNFWQVGNSCYPRNGRAITPNVRPGVINSANERRLRFSYTSFKK